MEDIRTIDTPEGKFYYASGLAAVLGIKVVSHSIRGFDETEIVTPEKRKDCGLITYKQYKNGPRPNDTIILLTEKGARRLICNSRSLKANELAQKLGIDTHIRYEPKESETLRYLIEVFGDYTYQFQCPINILDTNYRIDLYFPTLKLAIECDENSHCDRDPIAEQKRETLIADALGCTFIRYNPDAPDFNIFKVIREVHKHTHRKS